MICFSCCSKEVSDHWGSSDLNCPDAMLSPVNRLFLASRRFSRSFLSNFCKRKQQLNPPLPHKQLLSDPTTSLISGLSSSKRFYLWIRRKQIHPDKDTFKVRYIEELRDPEPTHERRHELTTATISAAFPRGQRMIGTAPDQQQQRNNVTSDINTNAF